MPANYTANYQLNQWVKSDRVLMEDFNADNAKVDAALKANASAIASESAARKSAADNLDDRIKLHTLASYTQSGSTEKIKMDLSGIRFSQWRRVYILFQINGSGASRAGFNDMVDVFDFSNSGYNACLIMTPLYTGSLKVTGMLTGGEIKLVKSSRTFDQITNLEIVCSSGGTISSGSKIIVRGEK